MDIPHFFPHVHLPEINHVPVPKAFEWLGRGWQDVRRSPVASLGHGFLVTMLMVVAAELAYGRPFLFAAMVSGFVLIGPILAMTFYEISRAHEAGEAASFGGAFDAWRHNPRGTAIFGAILALSVFTWERACAMLFPLIYGGTVPPMSAFMEDVFLSGHYPMLSAAIVLIGVVFASLVFSIAVVTLPMIMHREADVLTAMATSVRAVAVNPFTTLLWAVLIVILMAAGLATSLFGMLVVMPLLGHATWHAYRDMVR
jgi:uncharacterized membrane protein